MLCIADSSRSYGDGDEDEGEGEGPILTLLFVNDLNACSCA